ncbi:protein PIGMENT DEFECTIVE 338, chloroplastic [Nymphaea colorata]|nr:protein PIGMENT DEFECTIVE 338, chloroplastic [Nymphaea colorata]
MQARPLLSLPSSSFSLSRYLFIQIPLRPLKTCEGQPCSSPTPKSLFPSLKCNISRRPIFPVAVDNENAELEPSESNDGSMNLLRRPASLPPSPENIKVSQDKGEDDKGEGEEVGEGDALAPFLKFFKPRDSSDSSQEMDASESTEDVKRTTKAVDVEYYEPKVGDLVVGVVVSGNENKLDVNIGADSLGTMLKKEVLPLYDEELPSLLCDLSKDAEDLMVSGKVGIIKDDEALDEGPVPGRSIVELGTVLFAEVLGRTLSGRPLLSTRRLTRRIAWHRVRQIKIFNEPIEVKITEWNTGGLLSRIEGLRAFLPKAELINRVNCFTDLKENVGRRLFVKISRVDEDKNDLIISEREAWDLLHLREGTLLEGTVRKIFPYGAQIRIGETNRSGLLHITNITRGRLTAVSDLLTVDEKVKVLVVKSNFPDKISLSTAELESEPGLFLLNKEKVFSEAEQMARRYRQRLPAISIPRNLDSVGQCTLPFDDEATLYANWNWFRFEKGNEM